MHERFRYVQLVHVHPRQMLAYLRMCILSIACHALPVFLIALYSFRLYPSRQAEGRCIAWGGHDYLRKDPVHQLQRRGVASAILSARWPNDGAQASLRRIRPVRCPRCHCAVELSLPQHAQPRHLWYFQRQRCRFQGFGAHFVELDLLWKNLPHGAGGERT